MLRVYTISHTLLLSLKLADTPYNKHDKHGITLKPRLSAPRQNSDAAKIRVHALIDFNMYFNNHEKRGSNLRGCMFDVWVCGCFLVIICFVLFFTCYFLVLSIYILVSYSFINKFLFWYLFLFCFVFLYS